MSQEHEVECGICGHDGGPYAGCGTCHGNAPVQTRAFTLSQVRAGQAPTEDRYGADGGLAPKSSPLVVGGEVVNPTRPPSKQ